MKLYHRCKEQHGEDNISGNEIWSTFVVSSSFTFVCIAYLALQNLQSSLNQEANLGVLSLACMYAFFIVSAALAPMFIKLVGGKLALVIAWIGQSLYTISNFYPHFGTLIPASVILGLVSGPLWTSQSLYISTNAYNLTKRSNKNLHSVLSRLNGIFFTMYQSAQIFGNLISSVVLDNGSFEDERTNVTRICGGGECPLALNATKIIEPDKNTVYLLLSIFLACDLIGLFLTTLFLPPLPKSDWSVQRSVRKSVVSCFSALSDTKLLSLVPLMAFEAIQQTILYSDFTKSYISCPVGIRMVGYVMAAFGGSTAISSFVVSRIAKFTGRYILFATGSVINMGIFVFLYLWQPIADDLPYMFAVAGAWGIVDSIWRTQCNALIALLFPEKKEPAFANYHGWKSGMFTVSFLLCNFVCVSVKLIIGMALLTVAIALYITVEIRVHRESKTKFKISTITDIELTIKPPPISSVSNNTSGSTSADTKFTSGASSGSGNSTSGVGIDPEIDVDRTITPKQNSNQSKITGEEFKDLKHVKTNGKNINSSSGNPTELKNRSSVYTLT